MTFHDPLYSDTPLELSNEMEAFNEGRADALAGKPCKHHPRWPYKYDYQDGYAQGEEELAEMKMCFSDIEERA